MSGNVYQGMASIAKYCPICPVMVKYNKLWSTMANHGQSWQDVDMYGYCGYYG